MTSRKRNPLSFTKATSGRFANSAALILVTTIIFSQSVLDTAASSSFYILVRVILLLTWLCYALSLFYGMRILSQLMKSPETAATQDPASDDETEVVQNSSSPDDLSQKKAPGDQGEALAVFLKWQLRSFALGTILLILFGVLPLLGQTIRFAGVSENAPPCEDCKQCVDCKQLQATVNNFNHNTDLNLKMLLAKFSNNLNLQQEFDLALKNYFDFQLKLDARLQRIQNLSELCVHQQTNVNIRVNRGRRRKKMCECPALPAPSPATNTEE